VLRSAVALAAAIALWPLAVSAGGLSLPEPSAAALGRAGAATAIPDGPSAMYYNPGALPLRHGLGLEAGVFVEVDRSSVTPTGGATARSSYTSAIPSLFISQRLGDHYALGVGVYRAPTQMVAYPDGHAGRFRAIRASFGGTTLQPTVAGRPFSWLSIGFGLTVVFGDLDLSQAVGDLRYETRTSMQGKAVGLGGVIGLWARLYKQYLVLGLGYRSAVDLDHTGRVVSTAPGSNTPIAIEDARLTLPLPHLFTFGLGSTPRPGTSLQVEARLGLLRDLDGLNATSFDEPPVALLSMPLALRELVQLRAGAEQRLLGDRLALRIGVGYDLGAARRDLDLTLPDGDRVVISAGIGYGRPDFSVDAGYMASFSPGATGSRGYSDPAVYAHLRHTAGITLSVRIATLGPRPKTLD